MDAIYDDDSARVHCLNMGSLPDDGGYSPMANHTSLQQEVLEDSWFVYQFVCIWWVGEQLLILLCSC